MNGDGKFLHDKNARHGLGTTVGYCVEIENCPGNGMTDVGRGLDAGGETQTASVGCEHHIHNSLPGQNYICSVGIISQMAVFRLKRKANSIACLSISLFDLMVNYFRVIIARLIFIICIKHEMLPELMIHQNRRAGSNRSCISINRRKLAFG